METEELATLSIMFRISVERGFFFSRTKEEQVLIIFHFWMTTVYTLYKMRQIIKYVADLNYKK